ncbi:group-specific protein [Bacillus sp. BRMEA1]|nr:group-specific protein [Neobacillus endophyticus]
MISVQVNENEVKQLFLEKIEESIKRLENSHVFWDMKILCKKTCMSENNIKEKFFYDPFFPKYKIGSKWYIPAKEGEAFLLQWIREQPKRKV